MQFFQRQQLQFNDYLLILRHLGSALQTRQKIKLDFSQFVSSTETIISYIKIHRLLGLFESKSLDICSKNNVIQKILAQQERENLLKLFKSKKITYFELKGEILEKLLYDCTPQCRFWGDNDIYIKKNDLKQVISMMQSDSYEYHGKTVIEKRVENFGSLNMKGTFSMCDIHYSLDKAGKYEIMRFPEIEIFNGVTSFEDTYVPADSWYFRLLLFHFYAKHHVFGLGLLFELLLAMEKFCSESYADKFSMLEKSIFYILKDCKKTLLEGATATKVVRNPVLLSNWRLNFTYFEKRASQVLLFSLPHLFK